jgi:hypothetical protein
MSDLIFSNTEAEGVENGPARRPAQLSWRKAAQQGVTYTVMDGPYRMLWLIAPPALAVSSRLRAFIAIPTAAADIFLNVYFIGSSIR